MLERTNKPTIKCIAGTVTQVVPAHTRDAAFQLFCDLRANTPKDKRFLTRHVKAFTPQTNLGWLAVAAFIGYSMSALMVLSTAAICMSVLGVSAAITALLLSGVFIGSALAFFAFFTFLASIVAGTVAFACLAGYSGASASLSVMKHIMSLVGFSGSATSHDTQHQQLHNYPSSGLSQGMVVSQQHQVDQQVEVAKKLPPIKTSPVKKSSTGGSISPPSEAKSATTGPSTPKPEVGEQKTFSVSADVSTTTDPVHGSMNGSQTEQTSTRPHDESSAEQKARPAVAIGASSP